MLLALLVAALPAHAQMYKCVDERGVTHYSDKPRPGCKGGEVDIRPIPPVSGKLQPRKEDLRSEEREFQRRSIERGREEEREAKATAEQQKRCAQLKAEQQRLATARRIPVTDAKGERGYMDDAAREALRAKLEAEVAQKCR